MLYKLLRISYFFCIQCDNLLTENIVPRNNFAHNQCKQLRSAFKKKNNSATINLKKMLTLIYFLYYYF